MVQNEPSREGNEGNQNDSALPDRGIEEGRARNLVLQLAP